MHIMLQENVKLDPCFCTRLLHTLNAVPPFKLMRGVVFFSHLVTHLNKAKELTNGVTLTMNPLLPADTLVSLDEINLLVHFTNTEA